MNKPKLHVVSFSGGKDSTAMLLRMIEEGYPIDIILYCDVGLDWSEMNDHIDKVEEYIGRKITVIKSEKDFMWWATEKAVVGRIKANKGKPTHYGYGWPGPRIRWCTRHLKIDVIDRYLKHLREKYELVQYVGIAADEPKRIKADKNYPLVTWGMTEADCLKYCYDRGFTWGGLYEHKNRVSCWCCPLQAFKDLRYLYDNRSELWDKLKEMDDAISKTKYPNFRAGVRLTDIERRFEVEDEFIAQGKKLRTKEFFQALKDRGINY